MNRPRVRMDPAADADIDECFAYIAADNLSAAERFTNATQDALDKLAAMPGMGRIREFSNPRLQGLRSWPIRGFGNYLIFYRPIADGIEVLRILHGARDIDALFDDLAGK
jgi:toxin ParE1/3/4